MEKSALELKIRGKLGPLKPGQSFTAPVVTFPYSVVESEILRIAESMRKRVEVKKGGVHNGHDTIICRCLHPDPPKSKIYDMMGLDKAGDKKTFFLPPDKIQSLRSKASTHARSRDLRSRVTVVEPGRYQVELLAPTETQSGQDGVPPPPLHEGRKSKYPFREMHVGETRIIIAEPMEQDAVRISAAAFGRRLGRKYTCRKDGSTLHVTRLS